MLDIAAQRSLPKDDLAKKWSTGTLKSGMSKMVYEFISI